MIGALLAIGQAVIGSTVASAAVGTFSKAAINFPADNGMGAPAGLVKFGDVQAGGNGTDLSLVLVDPAGNWTLDLKPVTATPQTPLAVGDYVNSRIAPTSTFMGAFLHTATNSCGEEFGRVRIRSLDLTAGGLVDSIALDFEIQCGLAGGTSPTGPVISGWVTYKTAEGPIDNPPAGEFVPLTPSRLLDTRGGTPLVAGGTTDVTLPAGIPGTALAVVLNVTAINPPDWGFLTAYPKGATRPLASNLNFKPLQTVPNSVIVKLGTGNAVTIYNGTLTGSTDVAVDLMGYFDTAVQPDGGRFQALNPSRVLDTRGSGGPISDATQTLDINVPNAPTNVKSVVLNVTVANAQRGGFLGVTPGTTVPASPTSNLNFNPGDTAPNLVIVGATPHPSVAGRYQVAITVGGSTDVVVDLLGVFTTDRTTGTGRFVPIDPKRIVDTRTAGGQLGVSANRDLDLVRQLDRYSVEAGAVVFNGTGANSTDPTYLRFWPTGATPPFTSNLNLNAGDTRANLVIMGDDNWGYTSVFNAVGSVDVIADAAGWFTR